MDNTPRGLHIGDFEEAIDVPSNSELIELDISRKTYSFWTSIMMRTLSLKVGFEGGTPRRDKIVCGAISRVVYMGYGQICSWGVFGRAIFLCQIILISECSSSIYLQNFI
jgi:hypothetical protein